MNHTRDDSALSTAMEQIIENGFDGLNVAVSILINEAMRIERRYISQGLVQHHPNNSPNCRMNRFVNLVFLKNHNGIMYMNARAVFTDGGVLESLCMVPVVHIVH